MVSVCIVIPLYNAESTIQETLDSIVSQTYPHNNLVVSIWDDGSTDQGKTICEEWKRKHGSEFKDVVIGGSSLRHELDPQDTRLKWGVEIPPKITQESVIGSSFHEGKAQRHAKYHEIEVNSVKIRSKRSNEHYVCGPGVARNQCVKQSPPCDYIAFLDSDDVMMPLKIEIQIQAAMELPYNCLIGCKFERIPAESQPRYTTWCHSLSQHQLFTQRFKEITMIQSSWVVSCAWFNEVGGYDETDWRAEDMLFFHKHVGLGGLLHRVDDVLLKYRYRQGSLSNKGRTHRLTLLKVKIEAFERQIEWPKYMIWGAGRDGTDFFRFLDHPERVTAFIDVDVKKIGRKVHGISILSPDDPAICPPVVTCVAMMRGGGFESNLSEMEWTEGDDYLIII